MCDECAFCGRSGWQTELRLTAANELTCHDCYDDGIACDGDLCGWHDLLTLDELQDAAAVTADGRAHAAADRRAGL